MGLGVFLATRPTTSPEDTRAYNCSINDKLVNSCRPWLGVALPAQESTLRDSVDQHERNITRQTEVIRTYMPLDKIPNLSEDERHFINRPNTILFIDFKPTLLWGSANGMDAQVNLRIDQMADSIKAAVPTGKKVMLSVSAEPEADISSGVNCTSLDQNAQSGSPAEYKEMWRNVRNRFDARGAGAKVVWAMGYGGYSPWDCVVKDLYPGNELVDWITWSPYVGDGNTWASDAGRFYAILESLSDETHNFVSKPWGVAEWGSWHTNQEDAYTLYADAKKTLEEGAYPRLKLYSIFDAIGAKDSRIEYNGVTQQTDAAELGAYREFALSPRFSD